MKYAIPEYSREQVNAAGRLLLEPVSLMAGRMDDAFAAINNWRAAHNFPLNSFHVTLRLRARKVDHAAITAQRLKRMSSIQAKLRRESRMKLSQMQDIGGCRAIVRSVAMVRELVEAYHASAAKNPATRSEFMHADDYIAAPKSDGYRSFHLIYRYRSESDKRAMYNGLKIEVQLRSRLQHAWATAVETVSTFTGQALKSTGTGGNEWRRFFALMGTAIANREHTPPIPGTPTTQRELTEELRHLVIQLNVYDVLNAWRTALRELPTKTASGARAYLLLLDPTRETVQVTGFTQTQLPLASAQYLETEKAIEARPGAQVVLVSVSSLSALRSAYPNYYLDTRTFVDATIHAIAPLKASWRRFR
jgi:hypothetical protein